MEEPIAGNRHDGFWEVGRLITAWPILDKTNSQFKSKYQSLVIRRGHKRTIIALGHKILRVVYVVLNNQAPYHDPQVNHLEVVVKRNAPRWIKMLQQPTVSI